MFNICLSANEDYVKYAAALMFGIVNNTNKNKSFKDFFNLDSIDSKGYKDFAGIKHKIKDYTKLDSNEVSEGYIFHLFTNALSNECKDKLNKLQNALNKIYPCEIKIHYVDETPFHKAISWSGNYTAYYRLKIPEILKGVKTALYLDCDMLVCDDIRELFSIDLESKCAGVVYDAAAAIRRHTIKAKSSAHSDITFGINDFNSGFLLLNLNAINPARFWEDSVNIINNYDLTFPDQDVLNIILKDKVLLLSLAYNLAVPIFVSLKVEFCNDENKIFNINYSRQEYAAALKDIKIYHYTYPKPWLKWQEQLWVYENYPLASMEYAKYIVKMWWDNAVLTPIFAPELLEVKNEVKENWHIDFRSIMQDKINRVEVKMRKKMRKKDRIYISLFVVMFAWLVACVFFRF